MAHLLFRASVCVRVIFVEADWMTPFYEICGQDSRAVLHRWIYAALTWMEGIMTARLDFCRMILAVGR